MERKEVKTTADLEKLIKKVKEAQKIFATYSQDQVNAILFAASDEAKYITGITIPVSGGDLG